MTCNPLRWLWGLIPIAMLSWIAVHREAERIELDLEHRARLVLSAAGYDWVTVVVSGRNALLAGTTDNPHDLPEVNHLVRNVWGVHRVINRTRYVEAKRRPAVPAEQTSSTEPNAGKPDEPPSGTGTATPAPASKDSAPPEPAKTIAGAEEPPAAAPTAAPPVAPAGPAPASIETPPRETSQPASAPDGHGGTATAADTGRPHDAASAAPVATVIPAPPAAPPALPTQKDAQSSAASAAPVSSGALNEAGAVASVAPMTSPEASRAASPPAVATTTPPKVTTQTATAVSPEPPPAPSSQPSSGARHQATATATLSAPKEDAAPSACREASHQIAALAPLRFARGSTALGRRNRSTLDQLVKAAASCPTITLRVSGHADASGQSRHNAKLAERRAGAAVGYLIARGIDGGRLTAVGYGDSRPVAPNDNESDRAKNRRIEFEVSGNPEGTAKEQGTGNGLPDH